MSNCKQCGNEIIGKRQGAMYCSNVCTYKYRYYLKKLKYGIKTIKKAEIGDRFGRLVLTSIFRNEEKRLCGNFICDCGNKKITKLEYVQKGKTRSCGCLAREKIFKIADFSRTHGMAGTKTYTSWNAMLKRTKNRFNPNNKDFNGKLIKVCERWESSFENFLEDMGERPDKAKLIRLDNSKDYCKDNCVWQKN